jgi:hypothetical protein
MEWADVEESKEDDMSTAQINFFEGATKKDYTNIKISNIYLGAYTERAVGKRK